MIKSIILLLCFYTNVVYSNYSAKINWKLNVSCTNENDIYEEREFKDNVIFFNSFYQETGLHSLKDVSFFSAIQILEEDPSKQFNKRYEIYYDTFMVDNESFNNSFVSGSLYTDSLSNFSPITIYSNLNIAGVSSCNIETSIYSNF